MPCPRTATNVTSASPIMSAAAVTAVRPGLRTAFSRASRPAAPPSRRAGQPTTAASGLTRRDDDQRDADEQSEAAEREQEQHLLRAEAAREQAVAQTPPAPRAIVAPAIRARRVQGASAGASRPRARPRSAARASRAGPGRARRASVIRTPTSRHTMTVRVREHRAASGSSLPARGDRSRPGPGRARGRGTARRRSRRCRCKIDSRMTEREHLAARRPERAQGRELARPLRDRDRERVEDDEGADEERDGRRRRAGASGRSRPARRSPLASASSWPRRWRPRLRRARPAGSPGRALGRDAVLPRRPRSRRAGRPCRRAPARSRRRRSASVSLPVESRLRELRDAGDREPPDRAARGDADRVADRQVVLLRRAGVDRRPPPPRRPAARGQRQRVEPARARACIDADADRRESRVEIGLPLCRRAWRCRRCPPEAASTSGSAFTRSSSAAGTVASPLDERLDDRLAARRRRPRLCRRR